MISFITHSNVKGSVTGNFKSSHDILYPTHSNVKGSVTGNFKSSHDILYHFQTKNYRYIRFISNHLMISFIILVLNIFNSGIKFQIISWYPLSTHSNVKGSVTGNFKSSHDILYRRTRCKNLKSRSISNHLMISFINNERLPFPFQQQFQIISWYPLSLTPQTIVSSSGTFQIISWYPLSRGRYRRSCPKKFQIISWYPLSNERLPFPFQQQFQIISWYPLSLL